MRAATCHRNIKRNGEKKMTEKSLTGLAVVGNGAWSGAVADAIVKSDKIKLVTCFDLVPEKREAFGKKFSCDIETSYEQVLKRDDVEGVILIVPNAVHAELAVLATQHGKHVYVEKPIANTIADGKKMIDACQKAGVTLMVGHHLRRLAGFRKIKDLIENGAIGKPIQVEANFSVDLGFNISSDNFRWQGDDSGSPAGPLMSLGVHHADTFNYLFGPIKNVLSFFKRLYIPAPVEDVTTTIFEFESGVLGYLGSNFASPKAMYMYIYGTEANLLCTITLPELPFEQYLLRWQVVDQDTTVQIFEKGQTGSKEIPIPAGNPILEEVEEFAECIRTGKSPETDGQGALAALALIRASIESAETGKIAKMAV